jgi:hypothetical protein
MEYLVGTPRENRSRDQTQNPPKVKKAFKPFGPQNRLNGNPDGRMEKTLA